MDLVLLASLLLGWQEIVTLAKVDAIIAPSPLAVMADIALHLSTYMQALALTAATVIAGTLVGLFGGAMLAVGAWWSAALRGLTTPLAAMVRATPLVAVLPLLTRMMGYGISTNIAIVAIVVFFPIYVLGGRALTAIPPGSWDLFKALGATRGQALVYLAAPAAFSGVAVAARLNASLGVLAGFGAEYVTGVGGLGALYANERASFTDPALGWSVAVFSTVLAFSFSELVARLQKRISGRFSY
jgi:NitT/TauT family transport system permease protein